MPKSTDSPQPHHALPEDAAAGSADPPEELDALARSIVGKYGLKVRAEREARLGGDVVAADFYLRQLTALEVALDLASGPLDTSPFDLLGSLTRSGHDWIDIAETPFSEALDRERRRQWARAAADREGAGDGVSDLPTHPPERLDRHLDYSLEPLRAAFGPASSPAEGYGADEWAGLSFEQQVEARSVELEKEARKQVDWESRATAASRNKAGKP